MMCVFSVQMVQLGLVIHILTFCNTHTHRLPPPRFLSLALFFPFTHSLTTELMSVDVCKCHKFICQTCDPVILLNVTNGTRQLVSGAVQILSEHVSGKEKQDLQHHLDIPLCMKPHLTVIFSNAELFLLLQRIKNDFIAL